MLFAETDAAMWVAIITAIGAAVVSIATSVIGLVFAQRREDRKIERDAALAAKVVAVEQKVEVVHKATNSLVEKLVVAAENKGRADEKAEQAAKT